MELTTLLLPFSVTNTFATTALYSHATSATGNIVNTDVCLSTPFAEQHPLSLVPDPLNSAPILPVYIDTISQELTAMERHFRALETLPYPTDGASLHAQLKIIYEGMCRMWRSIDVAKNSWGTSEGVDGADLKKLEDRHFEIYVKYVTWQKYLSRVLRYKVEEGVSARLGRFMRRWLET
jgi:hypothetical protein